MLPLPLNDDVSRFSRPTATYALVIINILLFILFNSLTINETNLKQTQRFYDGNQEISQEEWTLKHLQNIKSVDGYRKELIITPQTLFAEIYTNLYLRRGQIIEKPWTLITHAFLHGDIWHLVGNLWFLFVFGRSVEDRLRQRLFVPLYLIGAISGASFFCMLSPGEDGIMIGASGAIFAVLGMYLVLFPKAKINLLLFFFFFLHIVTIPAFWAVGMFALYEIILTMIAGTSSGIAHSAHVGGFLSGLLFILALKQIGWIRWEKRSAFEFIYPSNIFVRPSQSGRYPNAPRPFAPDDAVDRYEPTDRDDVLTINNDPNHVSRTDSNDIRREGDGSKEQGGPSVSPPPASNASQIEIIASLEAAHLYLDEGQTDRALAVYLDCARIDPKCALRPEHQRRIAALLASYQRWPQALEANLAFIGVYPDHRYAPDCHLTAGEILAQRLQREPEAVPHLKIAARFHENQAMRNKARGLLALIRT